MRESKSNGSTHCRILSVVGDGSTGRQITLIINTRKLDNYVLPSCGRRENPGMSFSFVPRELSSVLIFYKDAIY